MIEKIIFIYLKKKKNLNGVKCIKDEDLRELIKEKQIKERGHSTIPTNFFRGTIPTKIFTLYFDCFNLHLPLSLNM